MQEPNVKSLLEAAAKSSRSQGFYILGLNDRQTRYLISNGELRAVAWSKAVQLGILIRITIISYSSGL